MAIRSALPWPIRCAVAAVVLGFCAAIALWAFELGKDLAGVDRGTHQEVLQLRAEVAQLQREREQTRTLSDTSGSLLAVEKAAQERFAARIKVLEAENRAMRDDLAFFQHLLPGGGGGISIRGLQAEVLDGTKLKWQVLLMQPAKGASEFRGKLEIGVTGTLDGRPWATNLPGGAQPLQFRLYRRAEGAIDLPAAAVVKNVTAKVVEGAVTRAVQTTSL